MVEVNRRNFLLGSAGVALASAVPVAAFGSPVPIIHGDGCNDDTAGFRAAISGKPFHSFGKKVIRKGDVVHIGNGTYRVAQIQTSGISIYGDG